MLNKKERIWEIDFLRGICIILMIFDHFVFILYKVSVVFKTNLTSTIAIKMIGFANSWMIGEYSSFRGIGRIIVLILFFVVAGISCTLSKNNKKRFFKLALAPISMTIVTIVLSRSIHYDITILWGVLHCYSACLLIYRYYRDSKEIITFFRALFFYSRLSVNFLRSDFGRLQFVDAAGNPGKSFSIRD